MLLHLRPPIGCVQMGIHWERQMLRPRTPKKSSASVSFQAIITTHTAIHT